jgi:hypothetical protein
MYPETLYAFTASWKAGGHIFLTLILRTTHTPQKIQLIANYGHRDRMVSRGHRAVNLQNITRDNFVKLFSP